MTIDAINQDVSDENQIVEDKEPQLTARELAMEAIASGRGDSFEKESGEKIAPDQPADQVVEPKPTDEAAQLAAQLDETKMLTTDLDKTMVRVKIDGVEQDVSVADMQRQYQKNGAAERRLEEATRLLREAQEAQVNAQVKIKDDKSENVVHNPAATTVETAKGKKFLAALFEGNEEEALASLVELTAGRREGAPTLDRAELAKELTPAIKQQLIVESASEKFASNYKEIVADPYLAAKADNFLASNLADGKPFDEAMDLAGKQTQDWLREKAGVRTPEQTQTISLNAKLDRKAGIDTIPAVNSKATTIEEPEPTAQDVIAEMRRQRGLA